MLAVLLALLIACVRWLVATSPVSSDCQVAATPIIEALERYRGRYGRYPADLVSLVSTRTLHALPRMPWAFGTSRHGYDYETDKAGVVYLLFYSEQDIGLMPQSVKTFGYLSTTKAWTRDTVILEDEARNVGRSKSDNRPHMY
jgi:hypothetical protein